MSFTYYVTFGVFGVIMLRLDSFYVTHIRYYVTHTSEHQHSFMLRDLFLRFCLFCYADGPSLMLRSLLAYEIYVTFSLRKISQLVTLCYAYGP